MQRLTMLPFNGDWNWPRPRSNRFNFLFQVLYSLARRDSSDEVVWTISPTGNYDTAKHTWEAIRHRSRFQRFLGPLLFGLPTINVSSLLQIV